MQGVSSAAPSTPTSEALASQEPLGAAEAAPPDPRSPRRPSAFTVDCRAKGPRISPLVYGIAYDFMHVADHPHQWQLGPTIRRWGGNASSRYNWELGNAWNTAQDWFWENVNYSASPTFSYAVFLDENLARGVKSALTIPMIGWVANDTISYSFPVSGRGAQDSVDQWKHDAGNGMKGRKPLTSPLPSRTSVPAPPAFIKRWIEAIYAKDRGDGKRRVHQYILDNEPNLWSSTHRDVHPEPVTYEELLTRTIQYGSAIRAADPEAVIAGPAEWGWLNYLYSARDTAGLPGVNLDRREHGNVPLVTWYLRKLREHEQKTGVRVLDVLDLHFYPQADRVHTEDGSPAVAARRIRSTRALWDPDYVDESWIKEKIMLLPRMKQWIAESYPGREISIGEWSFGGEGHMSGGLAAAEALGRFGHGEVTSAFYFTYPPAGSPVYWAFRAFRDFDGRGGHFLDTSVPTTAGDETSIFASSADDRKHLVLVLLNFSPDTAREAVVDLHTCGAAGKVAEYTYAGGAAGLVKDRASMTGGVVTANLPAYSINVLDVELTAAP
ncbi:MAG: glycoside hydrolase family 44 protein [Byssovorax sp.]